MFSINLNRRGSVLVHVLITGVVVAFIAAGLLRMVLMNYIAVDRVTKGTQNRKEAEALLQRAISSWNSSNQVCSAVLGLTCTPPLGPAPGICSCTCTSASGAAIVVTGGGAPPCVITATSSDPL